MFAEIIAGSATPFNLSDSGPIRTRGAPKWSLSASGIMIESKDDIIERIGRLPDCGDAVVMACWIDQRATFEQSE
jgi:hypothetical protein